MRGESCLMSSFRCGFLAYEPLALDFPLLRGYRSLRETLKASQPCQKPVGDILGVCANWQVDPSGEALGYGKHHSPPSRHAALLLVRILKRGRWAYHGRLNATMERCPCLKKTFHVSPAVSIRLSVAYNRSFKRSAHSHDSLVLWYKLCYGVIEPTSPGKQLLENGACFDRSNSRDTDHHI